MTKFTICADADHPEERRIVDEWLMRWKDKLAFLSDNEGCGCCVDIYDVEGSEEARAELPEILLAQSDWSENSPA